MAALRLKLLRGGLTAPVAHPKPLHRNTRLVVPCGVGKCPYPGLFRLSESGPVVCALHYVSVARQDGLIAGLAKGYKRDGWRK
jgi:hypothetical protein